MKISSFTLILLGLPAQGVLAAFLPDSKGRVVTAELEPGEIVPQGATEFEVKSPLASDDTALLFKCTKDDKRLASSADGRFVGCCLPGQHLSGSKQSGFECCGHGHELAGNARVGYTCCLKGFMYDGSICKVDPGYNGGGGQQQQIGLQQQQQQQGGRVAEGQQQQPNGKDDEQQQQQQQQQQGDHCPAPASVHGSNGSHHPCTSGIETGKECFCNPPQKGI